MLIAALLESTNSSILAAHRHFKVNSSQIRLNYASNMIGCGGDMHG